jgi:hypothetical protein
MLDHILNGIRSVGCQTAASLIARESGRRIGGCATHVYVQYDLASPSLRAKNFYFVQPSFAPGVIGSFYHAETTGMHGPDAAEHLLRDMNPKRFHLDSSLLARSWQPTAYASDHFTTHIIARA